MASQSISKHVCCLCGKEFIGYGNNPEPLKRFQDGRCCDECNISKVIPKRFEWMKRCHS